MFNSGMYLISVIISNYNGANFKIRTLESIKYQTCINWKFIVIDIGTSNKSFKVFNEYCKY